MIAADYVKFNEGLRLKPYSDSLGLITIGYGRCLDRDGITQAEADYLFTHDISQAVRGAIASLGGNEWAALDEARQGVLIDMCFQLGEYGLADFHNMLAAIRAGDWQRAHDEALNSLAARQTPQRWARHAETLLTGQWPKGA